MAPHLVRRTKPWGTKVKQHWLLDALTPKDRDELAAHITERTYASGESILNEGEIGHEAYVVVRGSVEIGPADGAGTGTAIRLDAGQIFGEQALLIGETTTRSASAVALQETTLLVLRREVVERAVTRDPHLLIHLLETGSRNAQHFLRSSVSLQKIFQDRQEPSASPQNFPPNTLLFEAGDTASEVYFLLDGQVEILDAQEEQIHLVEPGECFGEIGVMLDLPRTATAKTLTDARVVALSAETFNAAVSGVDRIKRMLFRLWRGYHFDPNYVKQFGDKLSKSGQLTTLVQLQNGRVAVVTRDPSKAGYKARVVGGTGDRILPEAICWGGSTDQPWFRLRLAKSDGDCVIQSIVTTVERPETAALYDLLVEATPITEAAHSSLVNTGMARPLRPPTADLLCRCLKVTRARVEASIGQGCQSVADVARATGCGTVCGACKTDVAGLLVSQAGHPPQQSDAVPVDQRVFQTRWLDSMMIGAGPAVAKAWGLVNYLRPGIVSIGFLFLPAVFFVDTDRGGWLTLLLALLFGYDLMLAHRQWKEVFVDLLEGGVEIGANEQRVEGFSEENNSGPRNVVMRRLPFWYWIQYKYTLRQDYILNSAWRWLRYQIRRVFLDRDIESARTWHPKAQPFWGDTSRELAELCIETSLCLGVVGISEDHQGNRIAVFRYVDWLCPAGTEVEGELIPVSMLEVQVNLNTRAAMSCSLNGASVGVGSDALCFLYLALSGYHHTVLHAYANWSAMPHHEDSHIRRAARWTLATNAVALYTGRVCQHDPRSMERVLKYNGRRGMARHGTGPALHEVAQHSRYARFVLRARTCFMQIISAHGLNIDIEALFLMTVVHSLDHHCATLSVDPYDLVPTQSDHRAAQIVRLIFSEPLSPIFVDTRLSSVRQGWPKDLYDTLQEIDPEFAAVVDLGIAY